MILKCTIKKLYEMAWTAFIKLRIWKGARLTVNTTIYLCVVQVVRNVSTRHTHTHCSMEHTSWIVCSGSVPFHLSLLTVRHEHSERATTINLAMVPPGVHNLVPFQSYVNPFHLTLIPCKFSTLPETSLWICKSFKQHLAILPCRLAIKILTLAFRCVGE